MGASLQDFAEKQIPVIAAGIAQGYGAEIEFKYMRSVPATFNYPQQTKLAVAAARDLVGDASVNDNIREEVGAEDFSYMLQERPGAYIFIGNGPSADFHHPKFDFNDEALPYGIGWWVKLVETLLPYKPTTQQ
ncbi:M20/M25/M40 family metallo-hydrolase [Mesorhizobium loti]|uniref:M20/M25/M40 family metallo-hydrolase n=1 Tax=Rhizobium loti TaxID=381 RepID=UPI001FE43BA6|nr:M20/M25/M40 family metallo-hydrolase [Mesorhizobium loti]